MEKGTVRQLTEDEMQSQMEKCSGLPVIKEMYIKTLSIISCHTFGEASVKLLLSGIGATT